MLVTCLKLVDRITQISGFFEYLIKSHISMLTGYKLNIKRLQKEKKKWPQSTPDPSVY